MLAEEEFQSPRAGPFLGIEHAGPQDHVYYNVLVTDDPTQDSIYKKDAPWLSVILTSKPFADRFARLASDVSRPMVRSPCDARIDHPEYSYAISGRITSLSDQEFCFYLNPHDSTRLMQALLFESLNNPEAPPRLAHVLDLMLARMPKSD